MRAGRDHSLTGSAAVADEAAVSTEGGQHGTVSLQRVAAVDGSGKTRAPFARRAVLLPGHRASRQYGRDPLRGTDWAPCTLDLRRKRFTRRCNVVPYVAHVRSRVADI